MIIGLSFKTRMVMYLTRLVDSLLASLFIYDAFLNLFLLIVLPTGLPFYCLAGERSEAFFLI